MTPNVAHFELEQKLREGLITGELIDLRSGDADADDPAQGNEWDAERTVPAALLVDLLRQTTELGQARALRLAGARITGTLDLEAAEMKCPILLDGCSFAEPVILAEASAPVIRLPGCHVPGLSASQLTTSGNLELNKGFTANGEVGLTGAHIGGRLSLDGATLTNAGEIALNAERLTVDQSMWCTTGFSAKGQIRLVAASIRGSLTFSGATLTGAGDLALQAHALTVQVNMMFEKGFHAVGNVDLSAAHIGGGLSFAGASLATVEYLDLERLRVHALRLDSLRELPKHVDLEYAQVGVLADDPSSWPRRLDLEGLTYEALYERPVVSARQRLDWLDRSDGYHPQSYEQLAAVYRRMGRDQDARIIAIAKQRARRRTLILPGKVWSLLLDGLVGFGYRTWLAVLWLLGFVLAGWWIFGRAYSAHLLVAAKSPRPRFHSGMYALDLLLPFVDLGYQSAWIANGWAQAYFAAWHLVGWVLITAVVAALSGLTKRD